MSEARDPRPRHPALTLVVLAAWPVPREGGAAPPRLYAAIVSELRAETVEERTEPEAAPLDHCGAGTRWAGAGVSSKALSGARA